MDSPDRRRRSRSGRLVDALVWGTALGAAAGAVLGAAVDGIGAARGALIGVLLYAPAQALTSMSRGAAEVMPLPQRIVSSALLMALFGWLLGLTGLDEPLPTALALERVSPLAVRRWVRRLRHHAAGPLLVPMLAAAIAVHHGAIGVDDVHDEGMGAAIELCLGVFTAMGAAVAAVAVGLLALRGRRAPLKLSPGAGLMLAGARAPEARAGPPPLSQLCVWRR